MNTYCTIITRSYSAFARVLFESLVRTDPSASLQVLVTDEMPGKLPAAEGSGLRYYGINEVIDTPVAKDIYSKYSTTNSDHFRWALKPVFLLHMLRGYDKVIFLDADIYFTSDHRFLFHELDEGSILLAPHGSTVDPLKDEDGLFSVLRNGLYSGGFVGATPAASATIEWWAEVCHYKIEKVKELGLYDDQKYLDLFPVLNTSCKLLRHPGCNLTNINIGTAKRSLVNNKVMINGSSEPVFIHFTKDTIHNIRVGNDPLLQPYLETYLTALRKAGATETVAEGKPPTLPYSIRRKFLVRTRIKRFFFKLAEKL